MSTLYTLLIVFVLSFSTNVHSATAKSTLAFNCTWNPVDVARTLKCNVTPDVKPCPKPKPCPPEKQCPTCPTCQDTKPVTPPVVKPKPVTPPIATVHCPTNILDRDVGTVSEKEFLEHRATPGRMFVYKFVANAKVDNGAAYIKKFYDNPIVRKMSLSTRKCDFDPRGTIKIQTAINPAIGFGELGLKPGQTYYINVLSHNGDQQETCTEAKCMFKLILKNPQ